LFFFSGGLFDDFQIAVNVHSKQFFRPEGESKFTRFATSLAQVLTWREVSCLSTSLSLSRSSSLDCKVKFCSEAKYFSQQAHAKRFMEYDCAKSEFLNFPQTASFFFFFLGTNSSQTLFTCTSQRDIYLVCTKHNIYVGATISEMRIDSFDGLSFSYANDLFVFLLRKLIVT